MYLIISLIIIATLSVTGVALNSILNDEDKTTLQEEAFQNEDNTNTTSTDISPAYDPAQIDQSDLIEPLDSVDTTLLLSEEEIDDLVYMREEEKLAHDVYTVLYERTSLNIFKNISDSEQTHTDAIKNLLQAYGITDPVIDSSVGVFDNDELGQLFTDLVREGSGSNTNALEVGALIEDLDIVDLESAMLRTNHPDITEVYSNLQKGSRNHLRSFVKVLGQNGGSYQPQYLSQEEYTSIVTSDRETGSNTNNGTSGRNQPTSDNLQQPSGQGGGYRGGR